MTTMLAVWVTISEDSKCPGCFPVVPVLPAPLEFSIRSKPQQDKLLGQWVFFSVTRFLPRFCNSVTHMTTPDCPATAKPQGPTTMHSSAAYQSSIPVQHGWNSNQAATQPERTPNVVHGCVPQACAVLIFRVKWRAQRGGKVTHKRTRWA